MQKLERRIDVTAAAGLGETVELAVTVTLPDPALLPARPVAILAGPGGGYSRGYFDMHFPGHANYSEAEWHAARGTIHCAIDHVGTGASTIPDLARITFQTLAACHDACCRQLLGQLRAGTLAPGFPALDPLAVGMGQSMGGCVTILTQGRFATFDAIAPCGFSAIHTTLPQRDRESFERGISDYQAILGGHGADAAPPADFSWDNAPDVDYRYAFHWEDVPEDILAIDFGTGYPVRQVTPGFGSATIPHCGLLTLVPGAIAAEAANVTVPVLITLGERDTSSDPHLEPSAYRASRDVSLHIVRRMAHMHNFASSRERLWRRLHGWTRMLAAG